MKKLVLLVSLISALNLEMAVMIDAYKSGCIHVKTNIWLDFIP